MKRIIVLFVVAFAFLFSVSAQAKQDIVVLKPEYIVPDPVFQVDDEGNIQNVAQILFFNSSFKDSKIIKKDNSFMTDYKKSIVFSDEVTSKPKAERAILFGVMINDKGDKNPLKESNIDFVVNRDGTIDYKLKQIPINVEKINMVLLESKGFISYKFMIGYQKHNNQINQSSSSSGVVQFAPSPGLF